jgi:predicted methyltransferase
MKHSLIASLVAAAAITFGSAVMAAPVADYIAAAISDPARPETQTARDAVRKPAEIMAFAGIKPGDKVGDFAMGSGYFTRLFSVAVGPTGKVYAYQPAEFIQYDAQYGKDLEAVSAAYENVSPLKNSLGAMAFPEPLDVIFTAQNYHDLFLGFMPETAIDALDKAFFDSLKPGGVLILIDHFAVEGTGVTKANSLHRIDVASVKARMAKVGFVLEAEGEMLRNPADPRTASVFDDSIKGKTDQFVLRFRKPA